MPDSDFVATTDEKGVATLYFSEEQVIQTKRISYWIGLITGGSVGMIFGVIVCLIA